MPESGRSSASIIALANALIDWTMAEHPALAVRDALDENSLKRLGSLGWHLTTVRLELEVRGEIARLPKVTPLRLTWIGA